MVLVKWFLIASLVLIATAVIAGQMGALQGRPPSDLGVKQGRLKAPSLNPNSVSSQADLYPDHLQRQYAQIAPLSLRSDGPSSMTKLAGVMQGMKGTKVIASAPDYVYAQVTTPLMKYVDDVEFWLNPSTNAIEVRSASRIGRSDLGANRKRIEAVRAALAGAQ